MDEGRGDGCPCQGLEGQGRWLPGLLKFHLQIGSTAHGAQAVHTHPWEPPWPRPGAQTPLGCSITGPDATATGAESSDFKGKNKRSGNYENLN